MKFTTVEVLLDDV